MCAAVVGRDDTWKQVFEQAKAVGDDQVQWLIDIKLLAQVIKQSSYEVENFEEVISFLTECISQADIRLRELNNDLFVQTLMELCTACGNLPSGPLSVLR